MRLMWRAPGGGRAASAQLMAPSAPLCPRRPAGGTVASGSVQWPGMPRVQANQSLDFGVLRFLWLSAEARGRSSGVRPTAAQPQPPPVKHAPDPSPAVIPSDEAGNIPSGTLLKALPDLAQDRPGRHGRGIRKHRLAAPHRHPVGRQRDESSRPARLGANPGYRRLPARSPDARLASNTTTCRRSWRLSRS